MINIKFKSSLLYAVASFSLSYYLLKFSGLGLPNAILFSLIGLFSASLILNDSKYDNAISLLVLIGITISLFVFKLYSILYLVALGTCMFIYLVNLLTKKHYVKNIILSGLSIFVLTYPNLKLIIYDIQIKFSFILISISLSILPLFFSAYKYFKTRVEVDQNGSPFISDEDSYCSISDVGSGEFKAGGEVNQNGSSKGCEGSAFSISDEDSDEEDIKFRAGGHIHEIYTKLSSINLDRKYDNLIGLLKKHSNRTPSKLELNQIITEFNKLSAENSHNIRADLHALNKYISEFSSLGLV